MAVPRKQRRGIRLTFLGHLIYRVGVGAMTRGLRWQSVGTLGRVALTVALIAVLLYNPFFTILNISSDLNVQHSLSYRATLAGSELRRCTFEVAPSLIPVLSLALGANLSLPSEGAALVPLSDRVSLPQAPCDSIWFRPPPSA